MMMFATVFSVTAEYMGDFKAGTYGPGDTVTWEGNCYQAKGQLSNINEDWNPTGAYSSYWTEVSQSDCESEDLPDNAWTSNTQYNKGDIVNYNGQEYKVLQAHTSQSDWTPDIAKSLFMPYEKTSQVSYLKEDYDTKSINYSSMSRGDIINRMAFSYVGAETVDDGIRYTWNHYKPQRRNNSNVQWVLKPIRITLNNDIIKECTDAHTTQICFNILVTGTDNATINNNTYSSVKEKAQSRAINEVDKAEKLKTELQESINDLVGYGNPGDLTVE